VIDDNADIGAALRAILEDAGDQVEDARDGATALRLAASSTPDVILLDLQLPPLGGFDVLRQIKASASLRAVPVIIVTGSIDDEDLHTAKTLGAWDYITKPWGIGEVEARVRLALQRAGPAAPGSSITDEIPARPSGTTRKKRPVRAPKRGSRGKPHGGELLAVSGNRVRLQYAMRPLATGS
jgi:DNA-binding response OmpR family regulator